MRFRTLAVGGPEFKALIAAQGADLVARGYTAEEADAMNSGRFEASWMPTEWRKRQAIAGVLNGKFVGWIHLLIRQDGVALVESLFVYAHRRDRGYARDLVREAVNRASRAGIETLEVYALDRDEGNDELWGHLLRRLPNTAGEVRLLTSGSRDLHAKGWRMPVADAMKALR